MLIISPRDEINRVDAEGLQAGLSVDIADRIETQVLSTTNQAALVVPIGGLAAYPTMIEETGDTLWLMQTIAHEWTHNWLDLRPLGYSYLAESPVIRTINETVASIAGDEIGLKVMRRYYLETLEERASRSGRAKAAGSARPQPEPHSRRPSAIRMSSVTTTPCTRRASKWKSCWRKRGT